MKIIHLSALAILFAAGSAAAAPKVEICHWDAERQVFSVINVSENTVDKHLSNHGDSLPGSYWSDSDGDGFGDLAGTFDTCPQLGLVDNSDDCDDGNASVSPDQSEVAYNGLDDDCNPATPDDDLDNDGYGIADDCDDQVATTNPAAEDVCGDGVDNNCDADIDENCAGACPCYSADDIQAAYDIYLAQLAHYESNNATCYAYDYGSYYSGYQSAGVSFQSRNNDYPISSEYNVSEFYSYGYDEYYNYNYCATYTSDYKYDYQTGQYDTYDSQSSYVPVNAEQRQACEDVALDWAATAGLTCSIYTF